MKRKLTMKRNDAEKIDITSQAYNREISSRIGEMCEIEYTLIRDLFDNGDYAHLGMVADGFRLAERRTRLYMEYLEAKEIAESEN